MQEQLLLLHFLCLFTRLGCVAAGAGFAVPAAAMGLADRSIALRSGRGLALRLAVLPGGGLLAAGCSGLLGLRLGGGAILELPATLATAAAAALFRLRRLCCGLVRQRRFDNDVFQDGEGLLLVRIATLYAVAGDGGEVVRDRRVIFSGFSVAQDADLVVFIAADGIGLLFPWRP